MRSRQRRKRITIAMNGGNIPMWSAQNKGHDDGTAIEKAQRVDDGADREAQHGPGAEERPVRLGARGRGRHALGIG